MKSNWLKNVLFAGHLEETSADVRKQILITSIFSLVSIVLLSLFGIAGVRTGQSALATIVLGFAFVNASNYLFLYWTGNYQASSMGVVILMMTLCFYLVCSGGNNNTGPLWFFILPSLIFYITGLRKGLALLFILMILLVYILYFPNNPFLYTEYPQAFTNRFVGAVLCVSVVSCVYEYSREDGRQELIALTNRLNQLSREDMLTGLSNRRDMYEKLQDELNRFERTGHHFCVLMIDLDHFKLINDTHGHDCGDFVLKEVALAFTSNTQKRDTVSRWGGEEFVILLPETTVVQAEKTAERLRKAIEDLSIDYHGALITLTISTGVAGYLEEQTLTALINEADKQLYRAKRGGRNRVAGMPLNSHSSDTSEAGEV